MWVKEKLHEEALLTCLGDGGYRGTPEFPGKTRATVILHNTSRASRLKINLWVMPICILEHF